MYEGHEVIDVHGHQTSPPEFPLFANSLLRLRNLGPRAIGPYGKPLELSDEKVRDAAAPHIAALDERNIDVQLLSPRPVDMWHWEVPAIQTVWCKTVNDLTEQLCRVYPRRFIGMAQLPQDVQTPTSNCIAELERCVNAGFVGAIVNPDPGSDGAAPGMADEYWYPLYEKAEELGAVLMIHASIMRDRRVSMVPHAYQINNFVGQFLAMLELQHGGVFDRFPNLRVYVCHLGGALNRFAPEDTVHAFGTVDIPENLYFDSCAYDKDYLALGIKQRGSHRILFGTECPGSGSHTVIKETGRVSDDLVPVIDEFNFLSADEKVGILHSNARRFFPLLDKALGS